MPCEHGGEFLLFTWARGRATGAGAKRSSGACELRQRTARENLIFIDPHTVAASSGNAHLHVGERLIAARDPIRALHGFGCECAAACDVSEHITRSSGRGGVMTGFEVAVEIRGHRLFERNARAVDGVLVGLARRLHVFRYRAIEPYEPLDDRACATCQRLVRVLHLAHRFDRLASGFGGDGVPDENDGRDGGKAEKEPTSDTELQRTTHAAFSRRHGVIWHKT